MQPQRLNKIVPQPLQFEQNIDDELRQYREKIAELEAKEQQRKQQEIEREKQRKEQEKREQAANAMFEALRKIGVQLPEQEPVTPPKVSTGTGIDLKEVTKISTQKGLYLLTGVFLFFFGFFAIYGHFGQLNDSEIRINNAAYIHFISHIWLAVSVILSGVAVQYLLFNMQARYFWTNIKTQNSFMQDFQKPTYEGVVRMSVCLFTFAFPTYVIAYIFQLILG